MGQTSSKYGVEYSSNDYQLAIELTKELEHVLQLHFGADGRGLHEKVSFVEQEIPVQTMKSLRYLASARNTLVHQREEKALQDRVGFINQFESVMDQLNLVISQKKQACTESPSQCIIS